MDRTHLTGRLDTRVPPVVRFENAALDDNPASPEGIVLRGRVALSSLRFIKTDWYQRELELRADIEAGYRAGATLPDIDLGVRGQDFAFDGGDCAIVSPCYVIDGWQRVGNALRLIDSVGDIDIRLGAMVHFNTTAEWEHARFEALNRNRRQVSANVHLRNMRGSNAAVATLYGLSHNEANCPVIDRVCWRQKLPPGDLLSAYQLAGLAGHLHDHKVAPSSNVHRRAHQLLSVANAIGLPVFRYNCLGFLQLVEECWGLRGIQRRAGHAQTSEGFLTVLARLLSNHSNFWNDEMLTVERRDRRKLAAFGLADPNVSRLTRGGPAGRDILTELLAKHMNSGRRNNRLTRRRVSRRSLRA